jgi:hypothetical protein
LGNLLEWYNFIFALPLAVGLILSLSIAFSGLGHSADAGDHGHANGDHAHEVSSPLEKLGGAFGFGRGLSPTLLLPILLSAWGLVGLRANGIFGTFLPPSVYFLASALLGLVGAALIGNLTSRGFARVFNSSPPTTNQRNLVGSAGRAVFRIDANNGVANVKDKQGNVFRVVCKTLPGEAALEAGSAIQIVDLDPEKGMYFVQAHPFPEEILAR